MPDVTSDAGAFGQYVSDSDPTKSETIEPGPTPAATELWTRRLFAPEHEPPHMATARPQSTRLAAHLPASRRGRALAAGLGFGVAGTLVALAIAGGWVVVDQPEQLAALEPGAVGVAVGLPLAAGLGAAISGAPLWLVVVERPEEPTLLRGAAVGTGVGILAHPLMWALAGLGLVGAMLVESGPAAVLANGFGGVAAAAFLYLLFTVVGLLVSGIVTIPVAAGTGAVIAYVRGRGSDATARERRPRHI